MVEYNKDKLDENKYELLVVYINDLKNIQKGDIPSLFETRAEWLKQALPFFPEEERKKYNEILNVGLQQAKFIRASMIFNSLGEGEEYRKATLDNFLESFE